MQDRIKDPSDMTDEEKQEMLDMLNSMWDAPTTDEPTLEPRD